MESLELVRHAWHLASRGGYLMDISYALNLIREARAIGDDTGAQELATEVAAYFTGGAPGGALEQYLAAALLCMANPTPGRVTISLDSRAVWGMLPRSHPARRHTSLRRVFAQAADALLPTR